MDAFPYLAKSGSTFFCVFAVFMRLPLNFVHKSYKCLHDLKHITCVYFVGLLLCSPPLFPTRALTVRSGRGFCRSHHFSIPIFSRFICYSRKAARHFKLSQLSHLFQFAVIQEGAGGRKERQRIRMEKKHSVLPLLLCNYFLYMQLFI